MQFIMLTYIFMLAWLGVTAFTSLPVFVYFNIWTICQNATLLEGASLCLDPRQFGTHHNWAPACTAHTHKHTHTHTQTQTRFNIHQTCTHTLTPRAQIQLSIPHVQCLHCEIKASAKIWRSQTTGDSLCRSERVAFAWPSDSRCPGGI